MARHGPSGEGGDKSRGPGAFGAEVADGKQQDEYVHNLQQQVYLLEIEAATLRAKSGMPEGGVASAVDAEPRSVGFGEDRAGVAHARPKARHSGRYDRGSVSPLGLAGRNRAGGGVGPWGAASLQGSDEMLEADDGGEAVARERLAAHDLANPFIAAARTRPAGVEDVLTQFRGRVAAIEEHCRECLAAAGRREAALRRRVIALTTLTEQYRAELGRLEEVHDAERRSWEARLRAAAHAQATAETRATASDQRHEECVAASETMQTRFEAAAEKQAAKIDSLEAGVAELSAKLLAAREESDRARAAEAQALGETATLRELLAEATRRGDAAEARAQAAADEAATAQAAQARAEAEADDCRTALGRARDVAERACAAERRGAAAQGNAESERFAAEERGQKLRTAATEAEAAMTEAQEDSAASRATREEADAALAALRTQLREVAAEAASAHDELREAVALRAESDSREARERSSRQTACEARDEMHASLQRALAQLEEARRREAALQDEGERLRAAIADAAGQAAVFEDVPADGEGRDGDNCGRMASPIAGAAKRHDTDELADA